MVTIYTFGDSHSINGWRNANIPNVKIHMYHIGAKLMYSFGRDGLSLLNITDKAFNPRPSANDYVVYCFGEIDCRCHIHNYRSTYRDDINVMVENYMKAIYLNAGLVDNIRTTVYNVVPTSNVDVPNYDISPDYPHLGSNSERKEYTLYMNECLKVKCKKYGYLYFDVYDKYCDSDGFLDMDLSDGQVHIRDAKYIEEFIKSNMKG